ncbi:DUF6913 domain-containing protein [Maribellus maritimus]|uniref:DUF6913 domain-containing protein n=1 Tax=Maribellus maritimus TaxID=2870838 RepID=UPI001EEBBA42|nr:hypothetical protein [Maribellus maritimus]MCG6186370.1 hypothetical protein [Maribellus maritimus]
MNLISLKIDFHQSFIKFAERMGIREKYANRKLLKTELIINHSPQVPDLDSVKKVGIIWEPEGKNAYQYIKDFFSERGVVVRGFCVYNEDVNFATDTNSLTPKELDWLKLPKQGRIDTFTQLKFDILLNIALSQNITLDFITLSTQAKFKVGWSQKEKNYLDLNINIGQNQDALFLAKQQIFYLGQLNQKTSK